MAEKTSMNMVEKWAEDMSARKDIQMATGHMKRCSAPLISREMHSKTTVRYHLAPVPVAIIRRKKCAFRRCREKAALVCCWWEHRLVWPPWRQYGLASQTQQAASSRPRGASWVLSEENDKTNSNRHTHLHIHCQTIYNRRDVEAAEVSFSREDVMHVYSEILVQCNKECNLETCDNM